MKKVAEAGRSADNTDPGAEIVALEKRQSSLETRKAEAEAALSAAVEARRGLLTALIDPEPDVLARAERAVRDADSAKEGAADALRVINGRLADARQRLGDLNAAADRERQATELDVAAKAVDAAVEKMRRGAADLNRGRADLIVALASGGAGFYRAPERDAPGLLTTVETFVDSNPVVFPLSSDEVACRIAGHLAAAALPTFGVARGQDTARFHRDGLPTRVLAAVEGAEGARALLGDSMRAYAAELRRGAAPAE